MSGRFDPGLQLERTGLAWQRTCLALGVAGIVGMRLTADYLGLVAVALGLVGIALASAGLAVTTYRYHRNDRSLANHGALAFGGLMMALVAGATLIMGAGAVAYLIGRWAWG